MEPRLSLDKIDSLKNEAASLLPADPALEKVFWDKFRLEFNYNSNHIEGNTLTYGHTQLLLIFDKVGADYTGREIEEMKAHDLAWQMVKEAALDREHQLSEKFIREINELILVRPFYKEAITPDGQPTRRLIEPGQYKKYPNSVRLENGEIFNYASPEDTPREMGELLGWYRSEERKKELHPAQLAAIFHYRFVRIHPFDDSNGRTSRLLMNYILLRNGYAPAVIKSDDKKNYLIALNRADTGDLAAFVEYIVTLVSHWQGLYVKAIKGEKIEEPTDLEKEIELLKRSLTEERKIKVKFSKDTATKLFDSSLSLFLQFCIQKISALDFFFYEKEISFSTASYTDTIDSMDDIDFFGIMEKDYGVGLSFILAYNHKGLKTKHNTVTNYTSTIKINFQEFTYHIMNEHGIELITPKLYDEKLSFVEIEEMATWLVRKEKDVIEKIL